MAARPQSGLHPLSDGRANAALRAYEERTLGAFEATGFAPVASEWQRYDACRGDEVVMLMPDGRRESGRVEGVAEDGALLLAGEQGLRRYHSGEVSLRPAGRAP